MKNYKELITIKDFTEVLNDINRLRILFALKQKNRLCVCEIFSFLDLPQNLTSYHLRVLCDAGLISFQRRGKKVFYFINDSGMRKLEKAIGEIFV
jgi:ArsR family transcriptional regulator